MDLAKYILELREKKVPESEIVPLLKEQGYGQQEIAAALSILERRKHVRNISMIAIGVIAVLACVIAFVVYQSGVQASFERNPVQNKFPYVLNGQVGSITLQIHGGYNDYLASKDRRVFFVGKAPSEREVALRFLNDERQERYVRAIADAIRSISSDPQIQARIAISMVQQIPYDKNATADGDIRYPYQVLYENTGVCSEKVLLMIGLLRELGFGTAIFRFYDEYHESVGVLCPPSDSYRGSGYCFVEATEPSIITDSEGFYVGIGQLKSEPSVIVMSEGAMLSDVSQEAADVRSWYKQERMDELIRKYGLG